MENLWIDDEWGLKVVDNPYCRNVARTLSFVSSRRGSTIRVEADGRVNLGGATLATGYLGRPDLTELTFSTEAGGERWFRTDDVGHQDAGGRWHVDGRLGAADHERSEHEKEAEHAGHAARITRAPAQRARAIGVCTHLALQDTAV